MKRHELLAPAGSLPICREVLAAGADAVYLGGDRYSARAYAPNFTDREILEAIDYAHLYGKKIFLTVNTLLKNRETGFGLYEYLNPFYLHGLDAIIVQDYGVFQFVRKNFPELPVHVSTQMSVTSGYGADFLKRQGAKRIVTARELSLAEIRSIYEKTGMEIESFIHGALCYSYSGHCLMSSMIGARSGNRGRCAQPCRLAYRVEDETGRALRSGEKYPLSPKDLCALPILPKLCEAGIYSFKIEGRMKQAAYAAGVTAIYRKYLDLYEADPAGYRVEKKDMEDLLLLGNRSGFTSGYYEMRNGRGMMALEDSSHSSAQAKEAYQPHPMEKIPVTGEAVFAPGKPARLTVRGEACVTVEGAVPAAAQKQALTAEEAGRRLKKTGDTPFIFETLDVTIGGPVFLPAGQINELRRNAMAAFWEELLKTSRRAPAGDAELPDSAGSSDGAAPIKERPYLNVLISEPRMLEPVLAASFVDMVTLDFTQEASACRERIHAAGKAAAICLPHVFRAHSAERFPEAELGAFDRIWVRNYDSLGYVLSFPGIRSEQIAADHSLYVYSAGAAEAFSGAGVKAYTASPELNRKEFAHMPNQAAEMPVYGYTPLMVSAQCVYKNYDRCRKTEDEKENLYLIDRYFKKFFIKRSCKDCYNIIYNNCPVSLFHHADEIRALGFASYRISFVSEEAAQIGETLGAYRDAFLLKKRVAAPEGKDSFTNGHFCRGVE